MAQGRGGAFGSGWPAGHEKAPDTPVTSIWVHSVRVWSRYRKQDEMTLGAAVVAQLPPMMRVRLSELWCDSQAQNVWSAEVRPGADDPAVTEPIADRIGQILMRLNGGHNGVYVGSTGYIDPDWIIDTLDD